MCWLAVRTRSEGPNRSRLLLVPWHECLGHLQQQQHTCAPHAACRLPLCCARHDEVPSAHAFLLCAHGAHPAACMLHDSATQATKRSSNTAAFQLTAFAAMLLRRLCLCSCPAVNTPGTYYQLNATGSPTAVTCPQDSYSPGLRKQRACVPCAPGFTTAGLSAQRSSQACGECRRVCVR
jgi:hypothetical protein